MDIDELEFDDANRHHIWEHGLAVELLDEILDGRYMLLRNRSGASGPFRLIGRDRGGALVTLVIARTATPGRWRVVTGWLSDAEERTHAARQGV
jgi:hypothetical protein